MDRDVTWWAAIFGSGGLHFMQPVVWLVPPRETAQEYAQRRLLELSLGPDPVVPAPPPGYVRCAIYTDDEGRPGEWLGFAERLFTEDDAGCKA